eukprot:TRINITY_DN1198_c0_g2_i1.p1 TRINITY_DN1198_c0_g2~~TRINITY_DN1198_c0_g2_i1.p1  ORF type:complete len:110 (+),score=15.02 TRINITY_DN1198_c0_g2_i1:130-459(+)
MYLTTRATSQARVTTVFAGREANRALGCSSLKLPDLHNDISDLTEQQLATLDKWEIFFVERYEQIGTVKPGPNKHLLPHSSSPSPFPSFTLMICFMIVAVAISVSWHYN